jgi:small subunit ribosomal protein S21
MLIVEVKKGNIEKALKDLKGKVIRTKQNSILFGKKEFVKKSVIDRSERQKAAYIQKLKSNNN